MPRSRNPNRRPRRRNGPRRNPSYRLTATQGDSAAYAGQQITILDVPGDVRTATATALGSIAQVFAINAVNIQTNFHGYFNSVFQEYRIRRVVFHVCCMAQLPGATFFRFEEKNAGAPSLNEMANSTSRLVSNNGANSKTTFTMTWIARDLADLGFEQITTDPTSAYFKLFTDNGNMGTPTALNLLWIFRRSPRLNFVVLA